ncbi:hypothetical protein Mzhil_1456 [Methanosalsum zhilinae DSM 4017]|uniref:Cardiolipin synthase N-terminal domain-containing protein n=1 Tax=Methanosalsum zhilinae (strain DSM 4017 / NBRC 107636 / OCM 62 / WeN5) TaxID=679901 RepID=F7XNU1_METZD|nr:hypothetical protein Mzhil_1456 [Methanosalsum zhilinae DSM 4017]
MKKIDPRVLILLAVFAVVIFYLIMMGQFRIINVSIVFLLFLALTVFWLWMLVDCATKETNEGNERLIWIIIIVFTHFIGALLYYFIRRPKRKEKFDY